jgi:hypothetical protein
MSGKSSAVKKAVGKAGKSSSLDITDVDFINAHRSDVAKKAVAKAAKSAEPLKKRRRNDEDEEIPIDTPADVDRRPLKKAPRVVKQYDNSSSRYAMEIITQDGVSIKKLIENIRHLLTCVDLRFYPNGIHIYALDNAKYALICIMLIPSKFLKYYCPEPFRISIEIEKLQVALNNVGTYEETSFIFEKNNPTCLILDFKTEGRQIRYNRQYIPGHTAPATNIRQPLMHYERQMEFDAAQFQTDIRQLCNYASMATFSTDYRTFRIHVTGSSGSSFVDMVCRDPSDKAADEDRLPLPEQEEEVADEDVPGPKFVEERVPVDMDSPEFVAQTLDEIRRTTDGTSDESIGDKIDQVTEVVEVPKAPLPVTKHAVCADGSYEPPGENHPWAVVNDYILRYVYLVAKNVNLSRILTILYEPSKPITFKFNVATLGYISYCILNSHDRTKA